jgi:hypothetical protein
MMPVTTFQDEDTYARFQSLIAHEYLHLWNVKRLVPAELTRPDLRPPTSTHRAAVGRRGLDRLLRRPAADAGGPGDATCLPRCAARRPRVGAARARCSPTVGHRRVVARLDRPVRPRRELGQRRHQLLHPRRRAGGVPRPADPRRSAGRGRAGRGVPDPVAPRVLDLDVTLDEPKRSHRLEAVSDPTDEQQAPSADGPDTTCLILTSWGAESDGPLPPLTIAAEVLPDDPAQPPQQCGAQSGRGDHNQGAVITTRAR